MSHGPGAASRAPRRRLAFGLGALVVILAGIGWLAVRGLAAEHRLTVAKAAILALRADLLAGRSAAVHTDLVAAQSAAAAADADTHDPVWFAVSFLPPVQTVRGLTEVTDTLARRVLPELAEVGPTVTPARLRVGPHTIALAPLEAAAAPLAAADAAVAVADARAHRLPGGWVGPIGAARASFLRQLDGLAGSLDTAARFARIGPAMLGADGPRTYFVGVQNNAESRGTGGIVGAFAVLSADHGTLRITARGTDHDLRSPPAPVADLGPDFAAAYGQNDATDFWLSTNLSMNFPYAGQLWTSMYEAQSGQRIDGAIGLDPVALADLLAATGPVRVPSTGDLLTPANVVALTEQEAYVRYASFSDQSARKAFLNAVAAAVTSRLLSGSGSARALASALGHAAGTGHLELYSAHPDEQAVIAGTPLGGQIPDDHRPFAAFAVDNAYGDKLDYYLERSLSYTAGGCAGPTRTSTITIRLTNTAPLGGLPPYVRIRSDLHPVRADASPVDGLLMFVYASSGAGFLRATLDGTPIDLMPLAERGHPMFETQLAVEPGRTATLTITVREPTWPGAPETFVQPLVNPEAVTFAVPRCP
ncbi:MAG TPA: DUF4012 domain-containing protein [Mycobacteriales bacterium]|nr:DUF4012 domain-containing protein [Mycobacteriales bacterium]